VTSPKTASSRRSSFCTRTPGPPWPWRCRSDSRCNRRVADVEASGDREFGTRGGGGVLVRASCCCRREGERAAFYTAQRKRQQQQQQQQQQPYLHMQYTHAQYPYLRLRRSWHPSQRHAHRGAAGGIARGLQGGGCRGRGRAQARLIRAPSRDSSALTCCCPCCCWGAAGLPVGAVRLNGEGAATGLPSIPKSPSTRASGPP
jgi:hypothetical protein